MGGQACVSYGAAEFSRDVDVIVLLDPDNLTHLQAALDELGVSVALEEEQGLIQAEDRAYWTPVGRYCWWEAPAGGNVLG